MENPAFRYREIIRTLPIDEALNLIIELLQQNNFNTLKHINPVIYQSEQYPLDVAQQHELLQQAAAYTYVTADIVRELLADGIFPRLRNPSRLLENDATQDLIRLTDYTIDMSFIDEVYDEEEDTVTLNGYVGGAHQVITIRGPDAKRVIEWLEQDRQRAINNEISRSNTPPNRLPNQPQNNEPDEHGELPF